MQGLIKGEGLMFTGETGNLLHALNFEVVYMQTNDQCKKAPDWALELGQPSLQDNFTNYTTE
jgi:hypothetical protein